MKDGPFSSSLDDSLHVLHVERQAYHGATFIGNHVHKMLQVNYVKFNIPISAVPLHAVAVAVELLYYSAGW